jgi:hypothetical protein|tara:strand:+ start:89 stop:355 length:267 start_codon:yes stop_codon:yes gene_type:complete
MDYSKVKINTYFPKRTPEEYDRLYITDELEKVSWAMDQLSLGHVTVSNVAPTKPRQGDIRYADGTNWNAGAGEGIYFFNSAGSWVKLG